MSKIKIFILGLLLFLIYFFLFMFEWGWIVSIILLVVLLIYMFLPRNNSIVVSFRNWKNNLISTRQKERNIQDTILEYFTEEEKEMFFKKEYSDFVPKKGSNIAVGMSGGVDSSVVAYLLKEQGYNVKGFFMINWDSVANKEMNNILTEEEVCQQTQDYEDAKKVADQLGIELIKIDFIKQYWDYVFSTFLKEIEMGITPNPDILCNRHIKFEEFSNHIFSNYPEIQYVAMGHYAKIVTRKNKYFLAEAKDSFKDQTYFLSEIKKEKLDKIYFPLGNLNKSEIREIAKKANLATADKKDSTGICFIGKRNFPEFISNYLSEKKGDILDLNTNKKVGEHRGVLFYTLGQRKGLNLGGFEKPYFVAKKDMENNIIYVSNDDIDSVLYTDTITAKNFNQLGSDFMMEGRVEIKTRHSEVKYNGIITNYKKENDGSFTIKVKSDEKIKAVTPGQELVVYKNKICLGGGQIV